MDSSYPAVATSSQCATDVKSTWGFFGEGATAFPPGALALAGAVEGAEEARARVEVVQQPEEGVALAATPHGRRSGLPLPRVSLRPVDIERRDLRACIKEGGRG